MIRKRRDRNMTRLHEYNYVKLLCVVPQVSDLSEMQKLVLHTRENTISVSVDEHTPYTTHLSFHLQHPGCSSPYLSGLFLQIRMYHDAKVAEVVNFQRQRRFDSRYDYPNPRMHQPNEKQQVNEFLGEWLDYCITHGYIMRLNGEQLGV